MLGVLLRHLRCWLALAWLCAAPALAQVAPELRLALADPDVDAWPAVTMLADIDGTLDVAGALHRRADFHPPDAPRANLGVRRHPVWLRIPMRAAESGRWLIDLDYPSLDRVDVWLVAEGVAAPLPALGDFQPYADRPLAARPHALPLQLQAGVAYELLLRVHTRSSMIVPLRLVKGEVFQARESRFQMLQGACFGIGLCLLMYALAQWVGCRDRLFLWYAGTVGSMALFFFAYFGLAQQYLWPASAWLGDNAAPLCILLVIASGFRFMDAVLDMRTDYPRLSRTMRALALLALAAAAALCAGVLSYRAASLVSTLLGVLPVPLALPVALLRGRAGDRAASFLFVGWAGYIVGIAVMALLLRGLLASNPLTQHAFQVSAMFEALMWLRVLGLRNEEARRLADRAERERQVLQSLAHTDPLTGLPNRRSLETELAKALSDAGPGRLLGVCLLDLDGFKAVNDRLGHDAGDALLVAVGKRLRSVLRQRDVVARLGGDEFVILAHDLAAEGDAWRLGGKLQAAFAEPFVVDGQPCEIGVTMGFALAPLDGREAAALLRRADAAMYAGKQSGKGQVRRGAASVGLATA
jgi:diguanylate cyclase